MSHRESTADYQGDIFKENMPMHIVDAKMAFTMNTEISARNISSSLLLRLEGYEMDILSFC